MGLWNNGQRRKELERLPKDIPCLYYYYEWYQCHSLDSVSPSCQSPIDNNFRVQVWSCYNKRSLIVKAGILCLLGRCVLLNSSGIRQSPWLVARVVNIPTRTVRKQITTRSRTRHEANVTLTFLPSSFWVNGLLWHIKVTEVNNITHFFSLYQGRKSDTHKVVKKYINS
jgi:hypothetical protein